MSAAEIALPPKIIEALAAPLGTYSHRGLKGGRGSGKSRNAAKMASLLGYQKQLRILCVREFQSSIEQSFHAELKSAIADHDYLEQVYDVGVKYLRCLNGTEFLFKGLHRAQGSIKSLSKVDLTIVEEAEDISEESWLALEATVLRQPNSEIWAIWNPKKKGSPVDQRFSERHPRIMVKEMNYYDNPFFPRGLEELRQRQLLNLEPNVYAHVWEGAYLMNTKAQVFSGKWKVEAFEPSDDWDGAYQGGDFGFANDPTAAVRCYIHNDCLFIRKEAVKHALELDDYTEFLTARIEGFEKYVTRWDCSRPESISHIKRKGLPLTEAVSKWSGSVEDGISFMRSFKKIIIHPECTETKKEFMLYSHKTDRLSGDVLPDIVDEYNHCIDAIRYALAPMIKVDGYSLQQMIKAYK